jgi:SAM-dependent methyltransferase
MGKGAINTRTFITKSTTIIIMIATSPFNEHVCEYEEWFEKYPFVFKSEVAAIKPLLPKGRDRNGIEIGVGTGQFAKALGIKEGIEPAPEMRAVAEQRGVFVVNAIAEDLPYKSNLFDFVLMNFCISYFDDVQQAFHEAFRVLKKRGVLIVGFVEKDSQIGRLYKRYMHKSIFYKKARFYSFDQIAVILKKAGFNNLTSFQTLFHPLYKIKTIETVKNGHGEGSYILLKAIK